ncbi:hypothetical protein LXA43DRAFT_973370 [Ganoderma leucocontextum]|nr:hypothetical protein LXA43DRAFT_973370 [Ganoderma leucocontextum]
MTVTLVLWAQNKVPAVEECVDLHGSDATIPLADVKLFANAADTTTFVSVFDLESGGWNKLSVKEDRLVIPDGISTILMRSPGVLSCPEFGEEIENIYRHLSFPSYEPQTPPSELTTAVHKQYLVEKRVVLWRNDRSPPVVFYVCMTRTFEINWSQETTLTAHLDGAFAFEMWELDIVRWSVMSVTETVRLPQDQRSLLLRRVGVKYTVGLGREIVALDAQVERFREQAEEPLLLRLLAKRTKPRNQVPNGDDASQAHAPVKIEGAEELQGAPALSSGALGNVTTERDVGAPAAGRETVSVVTKKRKVAFVGRVEDVEKVLKWKKRCGMPLGDVAESWRQVLPADLFEGPVLGDKEEDPIDVDAI